MNTRLIVRHSLHLFGSLACCLCLAVSAAAQQAYQKPPRAIADLLDIPPTPAVSLSPQRNRLLLVEGVNYPPISDLAQPMLRLAGERINPATNGPHRPPRMVAFTLQSVAGGKHQKVATPAGANLGFPSWSPDGRQFAFTNTTASSVELWVGDAASGQTKRVLAAINAAYGDPYQWMADSRTLLCQTVAANRGRPPVAPAAPIGPVIQESSGDAGPVRTFQDLLQTPHDEQLFDYYATSQLVLVDSGSGEANRLGRPAVYSSIQPSPDGRHFLVTRLKRPYSYLHPAFAFPREVEIWDRAGKVLRRLADLPLADRVPIEGVPTGPRDFSWRPNAPSTLLWVEALDEGDPRKKVPHRDKLMTLAAPFDKEASEVTRIEARFAAISWFEKDGLALLRDYDRDRRWSRTVLINADKPGEPARVVWDRSVLDRYGDPGDPMTRILPNGHRVLWQHGHSIFLAGQGASPQGDRPFLDRFDLTTFKAERIFHCDENVYETVTAVVSLDASSIITRRESTMEPPNYFLRSTADASRRALTEFPDPAPQLRSITKQLVTYQRADGVTLSFTLYLPPDYQAGERLPTVVWAYPREFTDPKTAGQVSGSPHRFTSIGGTSHLFFLLQGYAILDGATMPVVGDPETANNSYIEQIVASAQAAIDKAAEMGVTDPSRVGAGGHSYGAFMTANLLAHSDLFRAGIARSGAYNRTLTPFGFQAERRTFWEAPDIYFKMSPFMHADRINEPVLLIHGDADNNSGTFPIQSERMYHAIVGNGGTVRYVSLPYESHGYSARESVEHTLYEMLAWFDKHVKGAAAASARLPVE